MLIKNRNKNNKIFTLGECEYILADKEVFFREFLNDERIITDNEIQILRDTVIILKPYRNLAAHKEIYNLDEILQIRRKIVKNLNEIIKIFNKQSP